MTTTEMQAFRQKVVGELQENIYRISIDLAQDVLAVKEMEAEDKIGQIEKEVAHLKVLLEVKDQPKKKSKEEREVIAKLQLDLRGTEFSLTQARIKKSDLYKTIDKNARAVEALEAKIDFVQKFDILSMPEVAYIEIDGTRYAAVRNHTVKDAAGVKQLYVAPSHDKTK